jgi:hypothetical protein
MSSVESMRRAMNAAIALRMVLSFNIDMKGGNIYYMSIQFICLDHLSCPETFFSVSVNIRRS